MASLLSACLRKGTTCRRANFLRSMAVAQAGSYRLLSDAAVVEDVAQSSQKRQRKTKEIDPNAPVVEKRKAGRPKKIIVDKKIKVKDPSPPNARKPGRLTYATRLRNAPIFPPGWDLPPLDEWRSYFPVSKDTLAKAVVRKPESAALMAEAFVPEGSKDKIIIDASPGPGALTRALLKLPRERIKRLIVLEHNGEYMPHLKVLEELDDRVSVYPWNPKEWETYRSLEKANALSDVAVEDWDQKHSQLQLIMQITSALEGEQLMAQLFRAIPDKSWLFKYGRMPMNFVISTRIWERIKALENSKARGKGSVMAQAAAELDLVLPYESLHPYNLHFHPETVERNQPGSKTNRTVLGTSRTGVDRVAISAIPLKDQIIQPGDLEMWDYVIRKLFVNAATPVEQNINALGPGGSNLMPKLTDPTRPKDRKIDLAKVPRGFTLQEWALLVEEFKNWPFRPQNLGIETFFEISTHNR